MTREEAIKWFIRMKKSPFVPLPQGAKEAIDMAIEALQDRPKGEYACWLESIIVTDEPCWLCEYSIDDEWCHKNCGTKTSIQAECLRHFFKVLSAEEYEDYEHATLVDIKEPLKKPSAEAEPKITKVRKDGTLFVTVLDAEKVKKVFVNDLQGFCNTFCEEPKQDDDSDYDSLVPDEYKTETSDLISRADAIEAVRKKLQDWGGYAFEDYRRGLYEAQDILEALPSAELTLQTPQTYGKSINPSNAEVVEDYISRADAIDAIELSMTAFVYDEMTIKEVLKEIADNTKEIAISRIKHLPSADAVQGEWIMHIDDLFPCESTQECSVCHAEQPISISDDNYCPSCGARMENKK